MVLAVVLVVVMLATKVEDRAAEVVGQEAQEESVLRVGEVVVSLLTTEGRFSVAQIPALEIPI